MPPTVLILGEMSLKTGTPFLQLYMPVMMQAREGVQMEFVTKTSWKRAPSLARRSMPGVLLMREP